MLFLFSGDSIVRSLKTRPRKLADTDSAIESGHNSNLGRRNAYESLAFQQRMNFEGVCFVTYYSLLTFYTISVDRNKNKSKVKCPPLLTLDKYGIIMNSVGTNKFIINGTICTRLRKDTVVNLCPYVPINHCDEVSCFSNLLMHLPWSLGGELCLIPIGLSATQFYAVVPEQNLFPEYVKCTLEKFQHSDIIRKNVGIICNSERIEANEGTDSDTEEISHGYNTNMDKNETEINIVAVDLISNNGVLTNVCTLFKSYLMKFVHNQQKIHMNNMSIRNQINASVESGSVFNIPRNSIRVENYNIRLQSF